MNSTISKNTCRVLKEILIVEDDIISFKYLWSLLKDTGFTVHHAKNGSETMLILAENKAISVVLLDLHLPGTNGFDLVEEIKKRYPETIIIGQSAHSFIMSENGGLSLAFDDFIAKPVIKGTLFRKLGNFFSNFA